MFCIRINVARSSEVYFFLAEIFEKIFFFIFMGILSGQLLKLPIKFIIYRFDRIALFL